MVALSLIVLVVFVGAPSLWHRVWSTHVSTTTQMSGMRGQLLLAGHTATAAWFVVLNERGQVHEYRVTVRAGMAAGWTQVERWASAGTDIRLLRWSRRLALVADRRADLVLVDTAA